MSGVMKLEHTFIKTNGIKLHCAIQGSGPTVLFLHGFPEFWYCWKKQIPAFSKAFRVVAPDMRGYNLSDKPEDVTDYRINILIEDIRGLVEALGRDKITLVAHDWGGVLAWPFAAQYPDLLSKLVILNAPHPAIFARELKNNPKQQKASEYTLLLRSPRAEEVLSRNNFEWLRKAVFEGCKDPRSFDEEEREAYLKAWSQPGAISGGVNYYRASPMLEVLEDSDQKTSDKALKAIMIKVPTLVIWGEKDTALTTDLLNGLESCVSDLQIKRIPDATHWVQHDAPDLVNQYIWDFLRD